MSNSDKVAKFYNVVWTEYIPEYESSSRHLEMFFSDEEIRDKKILDAGCGTGIFTTIFGNKGAAEAIGIDISEGSLGTANKLKKEFKLTNVSFQLASMLNLPFEDSTFDIVWAWGTAHHTSDPQRAMDELFRVLKDDGLLLLALYKKTRLTWIHEIIRKTCLLLPRSLWIPTSKMMAFFLGPLVRWREHTRQKARQGEKLEELILDWYFVPIRFHYYPEEIDRLLVDRGFTIEKLLPASGRFESSSNFIFKARKNG